MSFKNCFALLTILLFTNNIFAQVGVGTLNPTSAAMLEVSSQDNGVGDYKGFILPRVPDIAARDAINTSPADRGLLAYVVADRCLQMWNGVKWINVVCDTALIGSGSQNFETIPADPNLPIYSETGSGFYTTGSGDYPNTPNYASGVRGYGVNNGAATLILGPVNVSANSDSTFKLRLAGFALNQSGNGMDNPDTVTISISTTGPGGVFSEELVIHGGSLGDSNNKWGFNANRAVATAYDGNDTPTSYISGDGITNGISYLEITGIPATANLAIKIELLNDKANELWVIDDAQLIAN